MRETAIIGLVSAFPPESFIWARRQQRGVLVMQETDKQIRFEMYAPCAGRHS